MLCCKWFHFTAAAVIFSVILYGTQVEGKAIVIILTNGRVASLRSHGRKKIRISEEAPDVTIKVEKVDSATWKIFNRWINKKGPTKVSGRILQIFFSFFSASFLPVPRPSNYTLYKFIT